MLNLVHLNHESMQQGVPSRDERWDEIQNKIKFDQAFGENWAKGLWTLLEDFKDVFVWHKKELGCCTIREHAIDTQAFPPCCTTPGRLFYWEKVEMNRQIQVLIKLGKMKNNDSKYACKVNLPAKKDKNRWFYGDYILLNM